MTIFAVIPVIGSNKTALAAELSAKFQGNFKELGDGWVVAASGTTKELSDQLGITDGRSGSAVILAVSSYFGRAPNDIWEWIVSKWGTP